MLVLWVRIRFLVTNKSNPVLWESGGGDEEEVEVVLGFSLLAALRCTQLTTCLCELSIRYLALTNGSG